MRVVIGGGSGFVGRALSASLAADGHEVIVVSRRATGDGTRVPWEEAPRVVEGADAVVNLAGASIGTPFWTARRREAIRSSRVETTRALAEAIASAAVAPEVFVTASGIDYYGDGGEALLDEDSPPGRSFLATVCVEWEAAASAVQVRRRVMLRTALVIGRGAPGLAAMALPFRLGLGGPLAGGRQFVPWIHVADVVRLYRLALEEPTLSGPLNAVAPGVVRQRELAQVLGSVLHRPSFVGMPAFALRLALAGQADLLLHGQRAVSRRLEGFEFRFPDLRGALAEALGKEGGA